MPTPAYTYTATTVRTTNTTYGNPRWFAVVHRITAGEKFPEVVACVDIGYASEGQALTEAGYGYELGTVPMGAYLVAPTEYKRLRTAYRNNAAYNASVDA